MPSNECLAIYKYFNRQWMSKWSPLTWNHYSNLDHRTTNRCEGYHLKLNNKLRTKPSTFALINILKSIELETSVNINKFALNHNFFINKRKKFNIKKDEVIELIKIEFQQNSITFEEFFTKMCHQVIIY